MLAYPRSDLRAVPGQLQIRNPDGQTFSIELIPTPRDFPSFVANIAGLVIIREVGKRRSYVSDRLKREFGLSSGEIKLIEKIAAGYNVRESAEMLMISYETARTYLKSVFTKTDTHSQQELFRFVLTVKNREFDG